MKFIVPAIFLKFSTNLYVKFKIVLLPLIPVGSCVSVYSGNFLRNSVVRISFMVCR